MGLKEMRRCLRNIYLFFFGLIKTQTMLAIIFGLKLCKMQTDHILGQIFSFGTEAKWPRCKFVYKMQSIHLPYVY